MQKVEGSSPFSRSRKALQIGGFFFDQTAQTGGEGVVLPPGATKTPLASGRPAIRSSRVALVGENRGGSAGSGRLAFVFAQ